MIPAINRNSELRNLPLGALYNIVDILEIDNSWQKVMECIPKDPRNENFQRKYHIEHMRMIENHAKDTDRKCALVLFDEWGTSGRIRPTVDTLMNVLIMSQMYRAADEIAIMLQEPLPPRPNDGPAAIVDPDITHILNGESMKQPQMPELSLSIKKTDSKNSKHTSSNHTLHNRPTKQFESVSDLIKFPSAKDMYIGIINKSIGCQSTAQIPFNEKDLIQFPESGLATRDLPDFSALLENNKVDTSNCTSTDTISESSQLSDDTRPTEKTKSTNQIRPHMTAPSVDLYGVVDSGILEDLNLIPFEYNELEVITNNFAETLTDGPTGPIGKIGRGGFGEVFVGSHYEHGLLAVKKVLCYLQFDCKPEVAIKVFNAEVKSLSQLRHVNIVPILGYSINGPTPCIVCKYIEGGSLEQKIADKVLSEKERMEIMIGTSEGLKYIHNTIKVGNGELHPASKLKTYFIHGDVKSANILLTKDCVPKLCDFGLAKQLESTYITSSMMGTSAYMPPEGFTGTITRKTDIFSFGIVILELLTGLRPIVSSSNGKINIKDFIEESCKNEDITDLLDPVVEKWTKGQKVYSLARYCLKLDRNLRPSMEEVSAILNKINHQESYEIVYAHV